MGDYDEPAENAPGILIGQTANGAILVTDELRMSWIRILPFTMPISASAAGMRCLTG